MVPLSLMMIPVSVTWSVPSGPTAMSLSCTAPCGAKSIVASGAPLRLSNARRAEMSVAHSVSPWIASPFGASSTTPFTPPWARMVALSGFDALSRTM